MAIEWQEELRPGVALREIVQQATAALIGMDADRLEELARCCADLNREIEETGQVTETAMELRSPAAAGEVELLGRVLTETRANFAVLSRLYVMRLREIDAPQCRYSREQARDLSQLPEIASRAKQARDYGDD